jgi:hypothetical protein
VFAPLSLLETQRKVTVVLRPAEIGEVPQAQPNDTIDQRIGELKVLAISHGETAGYPGPRNPCQNETAESLRLGCLSID